MSEEKSFFVRFFFFFLFFFFFSFFRIFLNLQQGVSSVSSLSAFVCCPFYSNWLDFGPEK